MIRSLKRSVLLLAMILLIAGGLLLPQFGNVASATEYCGLWLQPRVNYNVPWWIPHSHWLNADSSIDLTALTDSGRAWIFFYDEGDNWTYQRLESWDINKWGIRTRFVAFHYYTWFQNRWYLAYEC